MNAWLAYLLIVLAFFLGYVTAGRLSETEYDAKLRADWAERQLENATQRVAELEGRS